MNTYSLKRSLWTFVILAMIAVALWASVNLSPWTVEGYPFLSGLPGSFWQPVGGNLSVIQSRRGQPSLLCSDFSALDTRVEVTIRMWDPFAGNVLRGNFVGFALGFQPGDTTNASADYLLIDWRWGDGTFDWPSPSDTPGTTALSGLAVSRVIGIPTADEFWGHVNLDHPSSDLNSGLQELQRDVTPYAWDTDYVFTFEYRASSLRVFIDGVQQISITGSFTDGSICFYNFHQEPVTYSEVTVEPLLCIDNDGDGVCGDVDNCPDDANADQTDFNGDGVGDACTPCEPDPRAQGYWYRQCLGVSAEDGGIDSGRNGRGPQGPLEAEFDQSMDAVSLLLEDFFEFGGACAGGMDADPPNDQCEKALKQSTALLFNLVTSKLSGSCTVDLASEGCGSTDLTSLVGELEGLINTGDEALCEVAAACAAAVNDGTGLESIAASLVEASQPLEAETGVTTTATEDAAPAELAGPAEAPLPPAQFLRIAPQPPEAEAPAARPLEHTAVSLRQHLAVLSNPSAPEKAVKISTDALLTVLSGGYEPDVRIAIVRGLLGRIDVAYHGLIAAHLEAIRTEAADSGNDDLANEAARFLQQFEPSQE